MTLTEPSSQVVAVFDLDGTLTRHDTYLPYLLGFLLRHPWRLFRTVGLPRWMVRYALKRCTNTDLKRAFLYACLGGVDRGRIARWTRLFVDRLIPKGLHADAVTTLKIHRARHDVLVLLTASFDFYAQEVGRRLGVDQVICTQAEWKHDRLTGDLAGPNCHGPAKVLALQTMKAQFPSLPVVVYADHKSDLPLLKAADHGTLINGSAAARRCAQQAGVVCLTWGGSHA